MSERRSCRAAPVTRPWRSDGVYIHQERPRCRFYLSEKREGLHVFHLQLQVELCGDAAACEDRRVFLYSRGLKRLPARLPLTGSPRRTPPSLLTRTPLCLNPGAASIIHAASGAARHPPSR